MGGVVGTRENALEPPDSLDEVDDFKHRVQRAVERLLESSQLVVLFDGVCGALPESARAARDARRAAPDRVGAAAPLAPVTESNLERRRYP